MKIYTLLILLFTIFMFGCNNSDKISVLNPVDSLGWQESEDFYFQAVYSTKNHNGTMYTGNDGSGEILVFDESSLDFKFKFGKMGNGPGEFGNITDIEVFKDQVYVADFRNSRISVFSLEGEYKKLYKSDLAFFIEGGDNVFYGSRFPVAPGSKIFVMDGDSLRSIFDVHEWAAKTYGMNYEDKNAIHRWYSFNTIGDDLLVAMRFGPYKALINKDGEIIRQDYEEPEILETGSQVIYGKPQQYKDGFVQPVSYNFQKEGEKSYLYYYKNSKVVKTWYLDMGEQSAMMFYDWDLSGNIAWVPMLSGDKIYKFILE